MNHLQAVLEFTVELHKFINVDLFQRGFYQIRLTHKVPSKIIHKVEVSYSKFSKDTSGKDSSNTKTTTSAAIPGQNGPIVFPACIVNGSAVSKTFQILYKNEEISLNDVITFKTHVILDASRCIDQVKKINFSLVVELWFTEEDFGPQHHSSIQCVSSRTLRMNVDLCRGLHYHLPVLFDYFHLSAITVSIHAALTTLCQPYLKNQRRPKTAGADSSDSLSSFDSGYDYLLFGCSLSSLNEMHWNEMELRIRRAQLVHWQLCSIVFTSMQSMEAKLSEYRRLISDHRHRSRSSSRHGKKGTHNSEKNRHHSHDQHSHSRSETSSTSSLLGLTDIKPNQRSMSSLAQSCYKSTLEGKRDRTKDFIAHQNKSHSYQSAPSSSSQSPCLSPTQIRPGDYITMVESDLAYLSGLSILLWEQLMKTTLHSEVIAHYLGRVHHLKRVKRFSEGFFIIERDKQSLMSSICDSVHTTNFSEVSEALRKSGYFYLLPSCDVECLSLDGDMNSLPIIFQDSYDPLSHHKPMTEQSHHVQVDVDYIPSAPNNNANNTTPSSGSSSTVSKSKNKNRSGSSSTSCLSPSPILTRSPSPSPKSPKNTVRFSFDVQEITNLERNSVTRGLTLKPATFRSRSKSPTPTCPHQHAVRRRQSSPRGSGMKASVTLSDLKEFSMQQNAGHVKTTKKSSQTSKSKTIPFSESLPDLSSGLSTLPLPKRRAKSTIDHNKERRNRNRLHPSSALEIYEGTTYFPKPPPQFSTKSPDKGKNASPDRNCHLQSPKDSKSGGKDDLEDVLSKDLQEISISFKKPHDLKSGKSEVDKTNLQRVIDIDALSTHSCFVCEVGKKCSCNTASLLQIEHEQETSHHSVSLPSSPRLSSSSSEMLTASLRRASGVSSRLISFLEAKEEFRRDKGKGWNIYSDFNSLASITPYFEVNPDSVISLHRPIHLVICVHGLDGNSGDLRLVKTYLELGLPHVNFDFLMSQRNQGETFDCFETLTDRLVKEIVYYIEVYRLHPEKISFIGHSLGNIIIRAALTHPNMKPWLPRLHTFLSLSAPHLGTAYNPSGLVNMGLWVFQKWKKSASLLQLAMKDNVDIRQCYLYKLSQEPGLEHFQFVLLCGSSQDNYVPIHSAHIELCSAALNDTSVNGAAYREMVSHLLQPLVNSERCKLSRFDVHHALSPSSANSLIGRAAHIAVLDSELFIEKFMVVCGLQYFA